MATTPRKTFPELAALTAPVVGSDVVAVYRSPGPAKRTTAETLGQYFLSPLTKDVSDTAYTLTSADLGYTIFFTAATAVTVTVPAGLTAKFWCVFCQYGTGTVTVTPSSTTVNQADGLFSTSSQYAVASLIGKSANVYVLTGQLA